jgi:hypothetical protein
MKMGVAGRTMSVHGCKADSTSVTTDFRKVPILLQNSQNAMRSISRKLTKRAAIADRCSLQAIAEVACEFIADYVVPQMIIRSPRVHPGTLVLVDTKRLLQQYLPGPEFSPLHSHP